MSAEAYAMRGSRVIAGLLEVALFPGTGHYALGLRRQALVWFALNLAYGRGSSSPG